MATPMQQLAAASVPAYFCPPGTKMHILNLGTMNVDEGWLLNGANGSTANNPSPISKRRDLMFIAGLIDHPELGLILFETGGAEDVDRQWGEISTDLIPRTTYEPRHHLPAAIKSTGYDISDVKAVIVGHLYLDHAGGLEHFRNTGVRFMCMRRNSNMLVGRRRRGRMGGVYLADYLTLDTLNWQTFNEPQLDLCTGIILYHCPGHTPGLCIMQINLAEDGTFIWTTDQFHVKENYTLDQAQGWLLRDHRAWIANGTFVKRLQRLFRARLIFGHDVEVAEGFIKEKRVYQ
ncbi:beta-lactamase-like protein [Aspergillus crustosus]